MIKQNLVIKTSLRAIVCCIKLVSISGVGFNKMFPRVKFIVIIMESFLTIKVDDLDILNR